ncbi:MAG: hypothetical protein CMA10_00465 [Euryarchaeota archaeon]|nr:hypothetical protein [Euryarchaeota archaeon]
MIERNIYVPKQLVGIVNRAIVSESLTKSSRDFFPQDYVGKKIERDGFRFHHSIIDVRNEYTQVNKGQEQGGGVLFRQLYSLREDVKLQNYLLDNVLNKIHDNLDDIVLLLRSLLRTRDYKNVVDVFRISPLKGSTNHNIVSGVILAHSMIGEFKEMLLMIEGMDLEECDVVVKSNIFQALIVADVEAYELDNYLETVLKGASKSDIYHLMRAAYNGGNYDYCVRLGESQGSGLKVTLLLCRALWRVGEIERALESFRNIKVNDDTIILVPQIVNVGIQIQAFQEVKKWVKVGGLDDTVVRYLDGIKEGDLEETLQAFADSIERKIMLPDFQILKCIRISNDFKTTLQRLFAICHKDPIPLGIIARYSVMYGFDDIGQQAFDLLASMYLCKPSDKDVSTSLFENIWKTSRLDYIDWAFEFIIYSKRYDDIEQGFVEKVCELAKNTQWVPGEKPNGVRIEQLAEVKVFESLIHQYGRVEPIYSPKPNLVLIVNNSVRIGGSERQVVNCLRAQGHQSIVVVYNEHINTPENSFIDDVKKMEIEIMDYSKPSVISNKSIDQLIEHFLSLLPVSPTLNPGMKSKIRNLCSIILQKRPAVIHLWQDTTNILGAIAGLICGVPRIIMNVRSIPPYPLPDSDFPEKGAKYYFNNRYVRELYSLVLSFPTVKLCHNSKQGIQYYAKWLKMDAGGIKQLTNGFDITHSSRLRHKVHNNLPIVGSVFRFVEVKQPKIWIQTAYELHQMMKGKIRFVIAGDGPMMDEMIQFADELGIGDCIDFLGYHSDVLNLLNTFDLFLLTSSVEGLPNVLIEAQSMGVPVVSTDAGGSRETFEDGITGHLVTEPNPKLLAETLYKCLSDSAWMEEARTKSVGFFERNFSLQTMFGVLSDLLWSSGE